MLRRLRDWIGKIGERLRPAPPPAPKAELVSIRQTWGKSATGAPSHVNLPSPHVKDSMSAMRALLRSAVQWPMIRANNFTTADAAPPGIVGRPVYSEWSTSVAISEGFKASHWVFACVDKLMKAAGSVPWKVQGRDPKDQSKWIDLPGHDLEDLMAQPNPEMDGQAVVERITSHLFLGGNGMLTKTLVSQGGRMIPVELWPQNPDTLKPVPGIDRLVDHFEFRAFGEVLGLDSTEVIHLMFVDPGNPYWGLAPMQAGGKIIDSEVDAVNWWKTSLQNRMVPDGMISYSEPLGKTQYDAAKAKLAERAGSDNARGIFIASGGAKFERFTNTAIEMDFIESRKMTRVDICSIFGVPPPMVGIYDDATLANIKTARRIFWLDTIIPYLSHLMAAFNAGLCPYWGRVKNTKKNLIRLVYDLGQVEALQEDFVEKVGAAKVLWSTGVPMEKINTKLAMGIEEYEGWDVGWIPTTLLPASEAIAPAGRGSTSGGRLGSGGAGNGKQPSKPLPAPAPAKALPLPVVTVPVTEENWESRLRALAEGNGVKSFAEPLQAHQANPSSLREALATTGREIDAEWSLLADAWDWDMFADDINDHPDLKADEFKFTGVNTDARKASFWRSFDRNRAGYERQLASKMGVYFHQLGNEIAGHIMQGNKTPPVSQVVKEMRPALGKILVTSWKDTIRYFGGAIAEMIGGKIAEGKSESIGAGAEGKDDGLVFDPWSDFIQRDVSSFLAGKITAIDRTTRDRIRSVILDGFEKGHSIDQVAGTIREEAARMTTRRSFVIARTEIVGASNYASHQVAHESGLYDTHSWVSSRDDRVRDSHKHVDGETSKMGKPYSNGLMFPGDPRGPAKEVIQCRCVETFEMA